MGLLINILILFMIPLVISYIYVAFIFGTVNFDPNSVRGKRVLITGASSGIGEEVAYKYAELGAKLVITARRTSLLQKVSKKCRELGAVDVYPIAADMSLPADRKKLVAATNKHLGGLDYLILNHALLTKYTFWQNSPQNLTLLEDVIEINFMAYVDLTSAFLKSLEESRGYIGVVSSGAGKFGVSGFTQYCASKFALQGFYSSLRQELRYRKSGVSVTVIVYGAIDTEKAGEMMMIETNPDFKFKDIAEDAQKAAVALVEGVSARVYEVYFPKSLFFVNKFVNLLPTYGENYISWATNGFK